SSREDMSAQLVELETEKNEAVASEEYEEASRIRDEISRVTERIERGAPTGTAVVDEDQVAAVVSRATGIPASRLTEGERARLAHLEQELHARVIGQDDAVAA